MYKLIRPLLFLLSADRAHSLAVFFMENVLKVFCVKRVVKRLLSCESIRLQQNICGIKFSNPVGLAAGFDKNATMLDFLEMLGFGFIEVGSVTSHSSLGNPFPRMIRLKNERALINRCGLNNDGVKTISNRLKMIRSTINTTVGVNISKTHDPTILGHEGILDYKRSFDLVKDCSDYITINISCPNTSEGKTFEDPNTLKSLLDELKPKDHSKPIFLKLSPGLTELELRELITLAESYGVSGYVISNTSNDRELLSRDRIKAERFGGGGLSGKPLKSQTLRLVYLVYSIVGKSKVIVASGGIESSQDVYDAIERGASLVQIYSSMIYEGPLIVSKINRELDSRLKREKKTIREVRGTMKFKSVIPSSQVEREL